MAAYVNETVTIRYDPQDLAEIRVYYRNSFLCRAVCQELADKSVSLKDIIQARQKRKQALRKTIAERRPLMDTLLEKPKEKTPHIDYPSQDSQIEPKKTKLKLYEND